MEYPVKAVAWPVAQVDRWPPRGRSLRSWLGLPAQDRLEGRFFWD
jgi:hypothetical protein